MVSLSKLNELYKIGKKVMFLPELYFCFGLFFFMIWTRKNTSRGNFVGLSWEKLFFSWEKLGTFSNGFQLVTFLFGNFVGITFFFVGKTWEKLGKK
jgi:hypothetical protein